MASSRVESLDTNILLRIMLQEIPEQFELAIRLLECEDVIYEISDAVISEIVFVLTRMKIDRETIVGALTRITARPNIKVSDVIGIELFILYIEHPKLSFTDCFLAVESAMKKAEPLWTFDRDLAKESGTAKLLA